MSLRFPTVVAATDLSSDSMNAVEWAGKFALSHRSALVIAHVVPIPTSVAGHSFVALPPIDQEQLQLQARAQLLPIVERWHRAGLEVTLEFNCGHAGSGILEIASRRDARLLVAGTRGHAGLSKLFLGSTAAYLLRHAKMPTLTVRDGAEAGPWPVETALLPTASGVREARTWQYTSEILCSVAPRARIVLLHVAEPRSIVSEENFLHGCEDWAPPREVQRELEERANALKSHGLPVEVVARSGKPAETILAVAKELDAGIIAMGNYTRTGLARLLRRRTVERVAQAAPCPVLTPPRSIAVSGRNVTPLSRNERRSFRVFDSSTASCSRFGD
jgi:nucleotide-binding universal stress UspA family protein